MSEIQGWQTKRLDEIGQISSGSTPSTTIKRFWDGDIVWVTPHDLARINTPYLDDSNKKITEAGLESCSANLTPPGSLVISSRAPIGYLALPVVDFCTNQGCKSIKLKPQFDSEFTYYNVLFNIESIKSLGEGTTFAEISKAAISTVKFDFPESKSEQAKIAEVLSTVDRAIEQTEALIAKQQRIKAGLLQDLLTRGIDECGNLRSEATHAFKDSPLGRIPVEWEVKTCGTICKRVVVGIVIRPTQYYKEEGIRILRSANIRENKLDASDFVYMSSKDNVRLSKSRVSTGDLVTVRTGYPGTTATITDDFNDCNCVDIIISRPDPDTIRSEYLSSWINSSYGKAQVAEGQGGLAQQHFNVGKMKALLVNIPPTGEQQKIESIILKQEETINDLTCNRSKLYSIKTALMQDLLTGKKRVTPLLNDKRKEISAVP